MNPAAPEQHEIDMAALMVARQHGFDLSAEKSDELLITRRVGDSIDVLMLKKDGSHDSCGARYRVTEMPIPKGLLPSFKTSYGSLTDVIHEVLTTWRDEQWTKPGRRCSTGSFTACARRTPPDCVPRSAPSARPTAVFPACGYSSRRPGVVPEVLAGEGAPAAATCAAPGSSRVHGEQHPQLLVRRSRTR